MSPAFALNIDAAIKQAHPFGILSTEFRILLYIFANPGRPMKDVQTGVGLSHRGFYLKLQDLSDYGFVYTDVHSGDRRRRCVFVTDRARELLESVFGAPVGAPERDGRIVGALLPSDDPGDPTRSGPIPAPPQAASAATEAAERLGAA